MNPDPSNKFSANYQAVLRHARSSHHQIASDDVFVELNRNNNKYWGNNALAVLFVSLSNLWRTHSVKTVVSYLALYRLPFILGIWLREILIQITVQMMLQNAVQILLQKCQNCYVLFFLNPPLFQTIQLSIAPKAFKNQIGLELMWEAEKLSSSLKLLMAFGWVSWFPNWHETVHKLHRYGSVNLASSDSFHSV